MTEAAAPTERVRPDQALPITAARAAVLQEACAVAAAIHSALDLGVVARVTEAPAEPAAVSADCGLTQQGAQASDTGWRRRLREHPPSRPPGPVCIRSP